MDSILMEKLKNEEPREGQEETVVILEEEDDGEESISSDYEGGGVDCIARSRLRPMKDIWPSDEIVECLRSMDAWEVGNLVCSGKVEDVLAIPGADGVATLWACWLGKPAILKALLEKKVDPLLQDVDGRTGLHLSALVGNVECLSLLLEFGGLASVWDGAHKATPLHCAASARSLPCIQILIKHGADANAGINERSALHYAVQSEAADCVKELLINGARPDTPQVFTETPLHVAAAIGSSECTRILLEHGADARARFGVGRLTALHLAAEDGQLACAQELLDKGAPIDSPNNRHQTPLHLGCIAQALDIVELLVSRKAQLSARDDDGRTPLHAALGRSSRGLECAKALLVAGADPNMPDNYGYTPVHLAALNEFSTSVTMLLDYGGDVTLRTKGGHSALSFIVRRTPEVLPYYTKKFDDAIKVADHEIGDVDCELKLDFRALVPMTERLGKNAIGSKGESNLLLSFVEVGRREVLKHPLCETFLHLKWKRIRKFFLASLIYHIIFVLLFSAYIVGVYLRNCPSLRSGFADLCRVHLHIKIIGYFLLTLNILLVCKEIFQVLHKPMEYIAQWDNWLQWSTIISVFMCAVPGSEDDVRTDLASWQHHVAAIGIFLSWVELMLIVGRFPMFGLYIQMFATVSVNFAKFLMAYSCLLIAFGLSFGVLFANYPPFQSMMTGLLKTLIMMSGELEFEDIFYNSDGKPVEYPITAHVLFLGFVLLVTIILTNLLVGLAVSDIQALQESAGLDRLVRQAVQVARLEALLFSPLLRWVPSKLLKMLHSGALLMSQPYRWALVIRPNDPRENRIPRSLIASIYKLVAERKEKAKTAKREKSNFTSNEMRMSVNYSPYMAHLTKKNSSLRPRTTSDSSSIPRNSSMRSVKRENTIDIHRQIIELSNRLEMTQKFFERKMNMIEVLLEQIVKDKETQR